MAWGYDCVFARWRAVVTDRPCWKVWVLNLVLPVRSGRWLTAMIIFALLYGSFSLLGVFEADQSTRFSAASALFFSAILSYIVPIFHYITEKTQLELSKLKSVLGLSDEELASELYQVTHKHRRWHAIVLPLSLGLGLGHTLLLSGSIVGLVQAFSSGYASAALNAATIVVWVVMTSVIAALLDNAMTFARLARGCPINLLDTATLTPFARVAVFSTLALIGAQASFPLMLIEGETGLVAFLPGLIATMVPMVLLFVLPVWPVHRAIVSSKRAELNRLQAVINESAPLDARVPETLTHLSAILAFRREIQDVREWPFDVSVVTRLAFYLVIPPLTWVGAAVIENLVEGMI